MLTALLANLHGMHIMISVSWWHVRHDPMWRMWLWLDRSMLFEEMPTELGGI
jgi:hypothetical protein